MVHRQYVYFYSIYYQLKLCVRHFFIYVCQVVLYFGPFLCYHPFITGNCGIYNEGQDAKEGWKVVVFMEREEQHY